MLEFLEHYYYYYYNIFYLVVVVVVVQFQYTLQVLCKFTIACITFELYAYFFFLKRTYVFSTFKRSLLNVPSSSIHHIIQLSVEGGWR